MTGLRIKYPIIQAPMAGGPTTPELVALVSNAGGLGSIGAGYLSPDQTRTAIQKTKKLTNKPFNVNLFIPEKYQATAEQIQHSCDAINTCSSELGIDIRPIEGSYSVDFERQACVLLEEKVPVFSFTFGIPSKELIAEFKKNGITLVGTATTLDEALALEDAEVHAIVAQGSEAGGHRGSFLLSAEDSLVRLNDLLLQMIAKTKLPIIASGGIMNGKHIARLLQQGAVAAQLGTAFLCCTEAGVPDNYRAAILAQEKDNTILTRSFSGKLARAIQNNFTACMTGKTDTILDYPIQNKLTGAMRNEAKKQGNIDYLSLYAGQSAHQGRNISVVELMKLLTEEMK